MPKCTVIDGKSYRMRRGNLVEIPPEWVGKTLGDQTRNARPSKALHKHRKMMKHGGPSKTVEQKEGDLAVLEAEDSV